MEIKEDDPTSITGIYVSEANSESDPEAQLTEATCIVVGGYYDGQTKPTYYRIDFNPGYAEHPFGQILRNQQIYFSHQTSERFRLERTGPSRDP